VGARHRHAHHCALSPFECTHDPPSANDIPEKVHGIELYSCAEYRTIRRQWNGCGLILHELCHLIHQLVLTDGLDNEPVKDAYDVAIRSRRYDTVLR